MRVCTLKGYTPPSWELRDCCAVCATLEPDRPNGFLGTYMLLSTRYIQPHTMYIHHRNYSLYSANQSMCTLGGLHFKRTHAAVWNIECSAMATLERASTTRYVICKALGDRTYWKTCVSCMVAQAQRFPWYLLRIYWYLLGIYFCIPYITYIHWRC